MDTDDRFRLEPSRIEEEVPRVRKEQIREMFRLVVLWVQLQKTRSVLRVRGGVPLNPLILSVGAIGVMKEIGHASGKLEREVKLPFASGSRCKISIPVDVTREKRTNVFRVRANGSACTVKLKEQMITIGNTNKKTTNLLR